MGFSLRTFFVVWLAGFWGLGSAWAQTETEASGGNTAPPVENEDLSQETASEEEPPVPAEVPKTVERKTFTMSEKKSICKRYNNGYIAYYGEVFKVEECYRRPIVNSKTVYKVLSQGVKPKNVEGDVVAALPLGAPLDYAESDKDARSCADLENQYVTFSSVDVYFIKDCKKRKLPDWTTYLDHRTKRGEKYGAIISLSWLEFSRLDDGEPIESITDIEFRKFLQAEAASVDVLPIDEACPPVNGKYVSYYSNLYYIDRCRKSLVDPDFFFRQPENADREITEMTSEQWISIPDGPPIGPSKTAQEGGAQPTSVYQH